MNITQIFQAFLVLLILIGLAYLAFWFLIVALVVGACLTAFFAVRRLLVKKGIIQPNDREQADAQAEATVEVIEVDYTDVTDEQSRG